jgi:hypothetical protein
MRLDERNLLYRCINLICLSNALECAWASKRLQHRAKVYLYVLIRFLFFHHEYLSKWLPIYEEQHDIHGNVLSQWFAMTNHESYFHSFGLDLCKRPERKYLGVLQSLPDRDMAVM